MYELLEAVVARGDERGYALSQIGILTGNISAERAYEAVGYRHHYAKTHPDFEASYGCAGLTRMLRGEIPAPS